MPVDTNLGGFYTKAGNASNYKAGKALPKDAQGYRTVFVRCQGKRVTIRVDGVTTLDEEFDDLQAEGVLGFHALRLPDPAPPVVEFRNLRIRELPPAPK